MMTDINESILMSIPMLASAFPQLTNQQFINCAFLERPPSTLFCPLFYRAALIRSIGDSLKYHRSAAEVFQDLLRGRLSMIIRGLYRRQWPGIWTLRVLVAQLEAIGLV